MKPISYTEIAASALIALAVCVAVVADLIGAAWEVGAL